MLEYAQEAAARRRERQRINREQKKVVSFDHHVRQIVKWLVDPPRNRSVYPEALSRYEKMVSRIEKIVEKGCSRNTNNATRVNALEALLQIARMILETREDEIGPYILDRWVSNPIIECGMIDILKNMPDEERWRFCNRFEYRGLFETDWLAHVFENEKEEGNLFDGKHLFYGLKTVISLMEREDIGDDEASVTDPFPSSSTSGR
jgi:hypothetical protein